MYSCMCKSVFKVGVNESFSGNTNGLRLLGKSWSFLRLTEKILSGGRETRCETNFNTTSSLAPISSLVFNLANLLSYPEKEPQLKFPRRFGKQKNRNAHSHFSPMANVMRFPRYWKISFESGCKARRRYVKMLESPSSGIILLPPLRADYVDRINMWIKRRPKWSFLLSVNCRRCARTAHSSALSAR